MIHDTCPPVPDHGGSVRSLPVLVLALSALTTAFAPGPATPTPPADPERLTRDLNASGPTVIMPNDLAPQPQPPDPNLVAAVAIVSRVLDIWDEALSAMAEEEVAELEIITPYGGDAERMPVSDGVDALDALDDQALDLGHSWSVDWDALADCESGNWINGGASFEPGSARWYWARPGTEVPPWGTTIHHGGLQFHPGTWTSYKSDHHPAHAYDASREQQIEVAERVLAEQGLGAWPTCTQKLGWR